MPWMKRLQALGKLPKLVLQGELTYDFDGMPLVMRGIAGKKRLNLLKCGLDMFLQSVRPLGMPPSIQVEPTNICNLNCPLCPTGTGSAKRKKGSLAIETFRNLLEELGDVLISVILYSWGEPFLNKQFPEMIKECSTRNILTISSTNGNCQITLDDACRIVDSGLSALVIALDGSTQEVYQHYRKGGQVEKVKRFATLIEEAKTRQGSPLPYTNLRVVVNRENEEDLPNLERFARSLKMNMFSVKSTGDLTPNTPFADYETSQINLRRYEYAEQTRRRKPPLRCPYPYRQPTVFWDGTVVGCEFDYDLEVPWGKIGDQSFEEIWNGRQAQDHRSSIRKNKNRPAFCSFCPYRDRAKESGIISAVEITHIVT